MERAKLLLTLAPFVAVVFSVAYLQGYWGYFDILVFPYLSLSEIIAYSAVPLFGFIVFSIVGTFLGVLHTTSMVSGPLQQPPGFRKFFQLMVDLQAVVLCVLVVILDRPIKWVVLPLVAIGLAFRLAARFEWADGRMRAAPMVSIVGWAALFFVSGTFGWGRFKAINIAQTTAPNIQAKLDDGTVTARLLGKVNTYYFFLGDDGRVTQYPESAVRQITYLESFPN
jgi:hypothetical protein